MVKRVFRKCFRQIQRNWEERSEQSLEKGKKA